MFAGLFGACIGVVGYFTNRGTVQLYHELAEEASPKLLLLRRVSDNANRLQLEALSYALLAFVQDGEQEAEEGDEEEEERDEMQEAATNLLGNIDALQQLPYYNRDRATEAALFKQMLGAANTLIELCAELVAVTEQNPDRVVVEELKEEIEMAEEDLVDLVAAEIDGSYQKLDARVLQANYDARHSNRLITILVLSSLVVTLTLGMLLARSVTRPLERLKQFADQVGHGNLDMKLIIKSRDEVGSLAQAFRQMAHDLKHTLAEKTRLIQEAAVAETEKVRLAELEKTNRELEQFAYITSHDLKAPVISVASILQMVEMKGGTVADNLVWLQKARGVLAGMQNKIVTVSKVIKVKKSLDLPKEELQLPNVLDQVLKNIEAQIIERKATITTNFSEGQQVYFPKVHLSIVLQNLLGNAIKFSKPEVPPAIQVVTKQVGQYVQVAVSDNGRGIDLKAYGHKLFGLFQRFHLEHEGDGIGLHLVKNIMESYDGKIDVESATGQGTTFFLYFSKPVTTK